MKRAWVYIIIGDILIIEGTARVILGILGGNYLLLVGGLLTGWLLGGWLLRKGLKRRKEAFNDSIKARI